MAEKNYNDSELQMDTQFILCIEEYENKKDEMLMDTRLFIGYNSNDDNYFVRGKRQDIGNKKYVPYAFCCTSICELCNFIEIVIDSRSERSMVLYNFNNLKGIHNDNLTYEFFEEHIDSNYEVIAYDHVNVKEIKLTDYLRILKNTYKH